MVAYFGFYSRHHLVVLASEEEFAVIERAEFAGGEVPGGESPGKTGNEA